MADNNTSPRFGDKIAYVMAGGKILTLTNAAPVNKKQIIVEKITSAGDGIAIHCPFNFTFLMPSAQALVDVVDWEWMEENVID